MLQGKIYLGKINKELVIYLGYMQMEWGEWSHQFEYVHPKHPYVAGYGQNNEQLANEQYELQTTATVLYGPV